MSLLRNKTAEEIVSFIQGGLWAVDAHNDELNDQNTVFCVLRDILVYACPNGFGKTDDKQETAENVNHIPTNEELISSLIARPEDLRVKSNDVRTVNIKDDGATSEDYNMTYEESPTYCSNAASTYLRTIGDLRTIMKAIKWADEHPKVELPKWKRMPPSDQSYVDDFVCVRHIITPENTSLEVVQKGNYYIPMSDLEKFPKEE